MSIKRFLLTIIAVLALLLLWATPVLGVTDADVTVTYTVQTIAITDNATSVSFGNLNVSVSSNTSLDAVAITNGSNVQTDATIGVVNPTWTGGTAHTHSNTCTPGADTVGLMAHTGTGAWGDAGDVIVKSSSWNYIYENCPAVTNFTYGLGLYTPTSSTDGVEKTNTVRVTVVAG